MKDRNPRLKQLIKELKRKNKEEEVKIWEYVGKCLNKSNRQRDRVNVGKINRHTKKGETVLISGKVLGYGILDKKVNVAGFKFSKQAKKKIKNAGGKCMDIKELMKKNPKGKNIRIIK